MWQCRLHQIKHAVDVGVEGVIPFLVRNLLDTLVGRLEGGIVDENVEPPKSLQCSVDQLAAMGRIGDIARDRQRAQRVSISTIRVLSVIGARRHFVSGARTLLLLSTKRGLRMGHCGSYVS